LRQCHGEGEKGKREKGRDRERERETDRKRKIERESNLFKASEEVNVPEADCGMGRMVEVFVSSFLG
jgi:hypothetical protein